MLCFNGISLITYTYTSYKLKQILFQLKLALHCTLIEKQQTTVKGNFDRGEDRHIGLFHTCIVLLQTDLRSAN